MGKYDPMGKSGNSNGVGPTVCRRTGVRMNPLRHMVCLPDAGSIRLDNQLTVPFEHVSMNIKAREHTLTSGEVESLLFARTNSRGPPDQGSGGPPRRMDRESNDHVGNQQRT